MKAKRSTKGIWMILLVLLALFFALSSAIAQSDYESYLAGEGQAPTVATSGTDLCSDGVFDIFNGETDTDCGGKNCPKCAENKKCFVNIDCETGLCKNKMCWDKFTDLLCTNDRFDEEMGEVDIDCGGECGKCNEGKKCNTNEDCHSNSCEGNICVSEEIAELCNNGERDDETQETDIDCGGDCKSCSIGDHCLANEDCKSNNCIEERCEQGEEIVEEEVEPEEEPVTETPAEKFEKKEPVQEKPAEVEQEVEQQLIDLIYAQPFKVTLGGTEYTLELTDVLFSARDEDDGCMISIDGEEVFAVKQENIHIKNIIINPILTNTRGVFACRVNVYTSNYGDTFYSYGSFEAPEGKEELLWISKQDETVTRTTDKEYRISVVDAIKAEDSAQSTCKVSIDDKAGDIKLGEYAPLGEGYYLGVANVLISYGENRDKDACEIGYLWDIQDVQLPEHEFTKAEPKKAVEPAKQEETLSCEDTADNSFYERSVIEADSQAFSDECSEAILKDYFCTNSKLHFVYYECPKGCQDGSCMEITPGNTLQSSTYVLHTTSNILRTKWLRQRLIIELEGEPDVDGIIIIRTTEKPVDLRFDNNRMDENTDWVWNSIDSELTVYYKHSKHTLIINFEEPKAPVVEKPTPQPAPEQPPAAEPVVIEEGFNIMDYAWVAGIIAALFLLMLFILSKAIRPHATEDNHAQLEAMAKQHGVHEFNPQVEQLKTFIRQSIAKGYNTQQINDALVRMGWSNDLITEAFNEIREEDLAKR